MNIIVCVKQVPGTNKVAVDPVTGVLIRDGVESKLNPYDLYALETAYTLAEQTDGKVKALSMGPPQAKAALSEAIWMGADEAALLSDRKFGGADVLATSKALSLGVKALGDYDIILCGKQTTDGDTAQVGPELAETLGIEHTANVVEIKEVRKDGLTVVVNLDTVLQTLDIKYPCLLTVDKGINTPRLPSYNRKKQMNCDELIKVYTVADLKDADESKLGLKGSPTQVERIFNPENDVEKEMLEGTVDEMVTELYEKLKSKKLI